MTTIQRVSRRVQPQAPVGIDWSNPINVGLACAPNFGARLYDAVTGRIPAIDSGGSIVPSARGQALKGTLALSQGVNLSPSKGFDAYVPVSSDYTLSILFYVSSQTNASAGWLLGDYDAPGNATSITLYHNTAGDFSGSETLTSGSNGFSTQGLATVGWHWIEFVRNNSAGTWTAYLDNVALPNTGGYNSNNRISVANGSYRINRAGAWPNYTGLNGLIAAHFIWRRAFSSAERASIRNNPHQVFAPLTRQIWTPAAAVGDPTIALTGYAATGSAGILVPALSLATTGNSATASQGTATPALSLATTGNAATASAGTPVASITLALTGNSATSNVGTVAIGGTTQALTGNEATASAGTPVAQITLALTGNGATANVGTVAPALSKALTGNAATASAGTPVAALSIALTGNAATASAGTVAVPGVIVPSSNVATASAGTVSPGITIALTGNGATASVGTVSPAISLALSGLAGTSSAGIVVPGLSKALTGNAATAVVGSVAVATGDITLALSGNLATASVGSLAIGGVVGQSEWWRYDVPANNLRYTVPAHNLRYDVDTENLT